MADGGERPVIYFDHAKVAEEFKKGGVLLKNDAYRIHAGFREASGEAEFHDTDTDVFYVLEGNVTGGTLIAEEVEKGEFRGSAVQGGKVQNLSAGDVIVIPTKTPHWFKEVSKPICYFVVKVRDQKKE